MTDEHVAVRRTEIYKAVQSINVVLLQWTYRPSTVKAVYKAGSCIKYSNLSFNYVHLLMLCVFTVVVYHFLYLDFKGTGTYNSSIFITKHENYKVTKNPFGSMSECTPQ